MQLMIIYGKSVQTFFYSPPHTSGGLFEKICTITVQAEPLAHLLQ
jgi:hypothetical protein